MQFSLSLWLRRGFLSHALPVCEGRFDLCCRARMRGGYKSLRFAGRRKISYGPAAAESVYMRLPWPGAASTSATLF